MKILDTEGKMYWLLRCLLKGKGYRNALCLSRLILSEVSQGGTFYVTGSTGPSLLGWEAVLHGWQPHTGQQKWRQSRVSPVWALFTRWKNEAIPRHHR